MVSRKLSEINISYQWEESNAFKLVKVLLFSGDSETVFFIFYFYFFNLLNEPVVYTWEKENDFCKASSCYYLHYGLRGISLTP